MKSQIDGGTPQISVIIPTYNAARYLPQTIESVLRQSCQDFEVLVIDDGSTDETATVVQRYAPRLRYFRKPNGGGSSARNFGIAHSRGDFIAPLDADDCWKPDKLERTLQFIDRHPEAGMVFTACTFVDDDGRPLFDYHPRFSPQRLYAELLVKNFIPNGTVVVRRDLLLSIGGYDEDIFIPNDWDLWLRLAEVAPVVYLPEPLTFYRRAATSISRNLDRQLREQLAILQKAGQRRPELPARLLKRARAAQYYMMGHASLRSGRPWQALRSLLASLRIDARYWKPWVLLGVLCAGAHLLPAVRARFLR